MRLSLLLIWILLLSGIELTFSQEYTTISKLKFIGNLKLKEKELTKWSGLRRGLPWNESLIQDANKKIVDGCRARGYLMAHIDSVSASVNTDGMAITWYGSEGLPFYIGTLEINSDSIPEMEFWDMLDMASGMVYRASFIETEIRRMSRICAELGYPFAEIEITKTEVIGTENKYEIDLALQVKAGARVCVNRIRIQGNKVTRDNVILRELSLQEGDVYNQRKVELIQDELERLGFFKNVNEPKIIQKNNATIEIVLTLEEGNTTTFDGIVGYIPAESAEGPENGYLTGMLQLYFRNLFGTARRFDVFWRKPDQYSDEFNLYYEEPWVFGYRLNLGGGLERIVRDTTYVEQSLFINSIYRLDNNWKTGLKVKSRQVLPDSLASRDLRLAKTGFWGGELSLEYDMRNNLYNPRKGLLYSVGYGFGVKKNFGPAYLFAEDSLVEKETVQKYQIQFQYYNNFWRNQVVAIAITGGRVTGDKESLQLSDHFWFGGARTLRGYRENQFHGTTVGWANLEYRFLLGKYTRLFLFNDWGYYQYQSKGDLYKSLKTGYGLGVRFDTPLGVMGVDYGLPKGAGFSEGKIHVGLVNLF
jgi:outer membrane protein assembly complex protein YaeT